MTILDTWVDLGMPARAMATPTTDQNRLHGHMQARLARCAHALAGAAVGRVENIAYDSCVNNMRIYCILNITQNNIHTRHSRRRHILMNTNIQ